MNAPTPFANEEEEDDSAAARSISISALLAAAGADGSLLCVVADGAAEGNGDHLKGEDFNCDILVTSCFTDSNRAFCSTLISVSMSTVILL